MLTRGPSAASLCGRPSLPRGRVRIAFHTEQPMILRRLYDDKLAQASYLVGCAATGEALVVDPNRDVEQYVEAARGEGLRVMHVTETHIHADFVSGSRELARRSGAQLFLSGEGGEDPRILDVPATGQPGDAPAYTGAGLAALAVLGAVMTHAALPGQAVLVATPFAAAAALGAGYAVAAALRPGAGRR